MWDAIRSVVVAVVIIISVAIGVFAAGALGLAYFAPCTMAGCDGSVTVDIGQEFEDGVLYEAELCLDDECWRHQATFQDGASHTSDPLLFHNTGTITRIFFENAPRPKTQSLSIVVWADGEEIVRYGGVVEYRVQRPNGWFCEPVCYHGEVVV